MSMNNVNKSHVYNTINPLLSVLYLYQYGLLIPLFVRFNSQFPIAVSTVLLFLIYIFTNGIHINKSTLLLISIPLLLILFKSVFTPILQGEDNTNEILFNFFLIGISGIIIGSIPFNFENFLYYGTIVGWINFFVLFLIPLQKLDAVNYMRFGYAMLPTFCFSIYSFSNKKNRLINIALILVSGIEIIIFGARGAFFVIVLFLVIIFIVKGKHSIYNWIILAITTFIIMIFYEPLVYWIDNLIKSNGYFSYSIFKILKVVEGETLEATSSGRVDVYQVALKNIIEYPIFGAPLNSALVSTELSYYHNIILDIIVSFGVIFFLFFLIYISISFVKMLKTDNNNLQWIYCILFLLSFGRLMVSSTFWQRPEFWLFISFYVNNKHFLRKSNWKRNGKFLL
jgi:hypothetical protein